MTAPLFTVFTPTYNRAHTLPRVYDSLRAQTLRDFEWLIVDDGSTDNTEALVADWTTSADFPIRYLKQKNAGKHVAQNVGVREAHGDLFAPIDSDDAFLPDTLERLKKHWLAIPAGERRNYSGVGGLCADQHGSIIGDRFPASPLDSNLREVLYVHRVRGEKWGMVRTDVLRQYPFPELPGTQFVPEGVIGLAMSLDYKRRFVNEVFRVYYVDAPQTGATLSNRISLVNSAAGRLYYYLWLLNHDMDFFFNNPVPFLKAAAMLFVVARYAGRPFGAVWGELTGARGKLLAAAALPFSVLLYGYYRLRGF